MFSRLTNFTLLLILVSCGAGGATKEMPTMSIPVAKVQEQTFADNISFTSVVTAKRSYTIQPRISGFLTAIYYNNGMPILEGAPIFSIEQAPFQAALLEAKASVASAQASLREAESNYYRSVPLAEAGAISRSQFDSATATLVSARESVNAAKAQLEIAKLNLSYTQIYAPGSGIIALTDAQIGDYVGIGTKYEVLTTISHIDTIVVDVPIPITTYQRYRKKGRPSFENDSLLTEVKLSIAGREYPYSGVYQYTQQNIDQTAGTIILSFDFYNPLYTLKPGQYADVRAKIGEHYDHMMVPASAVNQVQGQYFLYVIQPDSTVDFRRVTVGQQRDGMWEISSGITSGEYIAVSGFHKMKSGMKILPISSEDKSVSDEKR